MSELIIQARRATTLISGAWAAHVEVSKAVARGDLAPVASLRCVDCGNPAHAYDHRDYGRPLDVEPVCTPCNAIRGAAKPSEESLLAHAGATLESEDGWKARAVVPVLLGAALIASAKTYRQAVRLAWAYRTSQYMTRASLAERIGAYASHVTDYFHTDDASGRRSLPPELIDDFECAVGNRAVTQYLMRKTGLSIMEEVIAMRAAA
ncbi:hypothetical protein [Paraburkholderia sp. BCC1885]|uniref:hypothetical protein n=1 Tax=Paraburkholderia sp. BCC1885 TaxID=2562669 RepID=UPI0011837FF4|nr:hypothetical protein [Paraburkholderia sp. BCC1885]